MKKSLFIIPFALIFNFMAAQGLSKNGAVVKDAVINNLKVGTVTYPNSDGTANQVLTTDGAGNTSWSTPSTTATAYNGILPVENGGTGSEGKNFVDLTTGQTITGTKIFDSNLIVNGITVGSYNFMGLGSNNTLLGLNVKINEATLESTVIGNNASARGSQSIAIGSGANANHLQGISIGFHSDIKYDYGLAIGGSAESNAMFSTALGVSAKAGGDYSLAIGTEANASAENSIAIGRNATASEINTIQLGNEAITAVKTSGQLTTGAVTYPNFDGTANQVLTTDGAGNTSWTTAASAGIPYTGATEAVNLGAFDLTANGITIGRGAEGIQANTAIGNQVLLRNTTGNSNTGTGLYALTNNTTGSGNTANGAETLSTNSTGDNNTAIGYQALFYNSTSSNNTAIGFTSLMDNETGSGNVAIGTASLLSNVTGNNNTAIGNIAGVINDNLSNTIAIGYNAKVAASNTIQLGNVDVTSVKTSGQLTTGAVTYPNIDGISNQVLTTDGAGTAIWTTPASAGIPYAGASQAVNLGEFDLTVNGITIGRGASGIDANTAIGYQALLTNTTGSTNTATGFYALANNIIGGGNTANGAYTLYRNTIGENNTAIGNQALFDTNAGSNNTAIGFNSLMLNETGSGNSSIGNGSLASNIVGSNNTAIGNGADVTSDNLSNTIAIGYDAKVAASNTIQLGNLDITEVKTSGQLTTGEITYTNESGSAGQVLTTNGAGIASWRDPFTGSGIPDVVNGDFETLIDYDSGKTIYLTQPIFNSWFSSNLPSGFTCTFINASSGDIPMDYIGNAVFYSRNAPEGRQGFAIQAGGTVKLNVIAVQGEKHYYLTGDVIQ